MKNNENSISMDKFVELTFRQVELHKRNFFLIAESNAERIYCLDQMIEMLQITKPRLQEADKEGTFQR